MIRNFIPFLFLLITLLSCGSKDDDNTTPSNDSEPQADQLILDESELE